MRSSRDQSWSGIQMGSTRTQMLLLSFAVLVSAASAQDANFGVKVKCYLQEGTVVCPGCNTRAGLLCPRSANVGSCNIKTEAPIIKKETPPTQIYEDEAKPTTIVEPQNPGIRNTTHGISPFEGISQEEIEYWSKKARENLQFRLFLYRILRPVGNRRWKRDVQTIEDDTCQWNGDCPCPLICCKTGDGCPKRCMKGIRLPPPWG